MSDTMVMTVRVPAASPDQLEVSVTGHDVTVRGPGGFEHELTMPDEADMTSLHAELFHGVLALRAPHLREPL